MKISARNQIEGRILSLKKGAINTIVRISICETTIITSVITNVAAAHLKVGDHAIAIIKASDVLVGKDVGEVSGCNVLIGAVTEFTPGEVSAEMSILFCSCGASITATVTSDDMNMPDFKVGEEACAIIKATSVVIGTV